MVTAISNGILNNPALGYVRTWMPANTRILAVVVTVRELFQLRNNRRMPIPLMRRLAEHERPAASAGKLEYPVFMPVAERIGHDRRRNDLYRRTADGEEVLVARVEADYLVDAATGEGVAYEIEVEDRVIDDEFPLNQHDSRSGGP